jgi:hypothetical protein
MIICTSLKKMVVSNFILVENGAMKSGEAFLLTM